MPLGRQQDLLYIYQTSMTQALRSSSSEVRQPTSSLSSPLLITNVRLPGHSGRQRLWVDSGGVIEAVESMEQSFERQPQSGLKAFDLDNRWLSMGGVDLQINGGLGLAFTDLSLEPTGGEAPSPERLSEICKYLWQEGVDAFLPTLVTSSIEQVHRALEVIVDYCKRPSEDDAAKILGVHLEGPCLAPAKRGAHPQEHLQPLTVEAMDQVLGKNGRIVKMVTLAPELDPTGEVVQSLLDQGIAVSLGHSLATAQQAEVAFERGATLVTHAFNAMPSLHHREPGLLGAALTQPLDGRGEAQVRCGFIADGEHISPMMLKLLWRMGGQERLFLVSDALAPLGLPDGTYPWDSREITVTDGTARLADGTLSGTTRSLLYGVKNLAEWGICSVEDAIVLATDAPRKAIGEFPMAGSKSRQRQYVGRSIHQLLQWTWEEATQELTWKRFERD